MKIMTAVATLLIVAACSSSATSANSDSYACSKLDQPSLLDRYETISNTRTDPRVMFGKQPTILMTASQSDFAALESRFREDLSRFDYIDLYVMTDHVEDVRGFRIEFMDQSYRNGFAYQAAPFLKRTEEAGWQHLHIPKGWFEPAIGQPAWDKVSILKIDFAGNHEAVAVHIGPVVPVVQQRGAVYMYFDDGYASQYDQAFPVMRRYGLPGTIAVITSKVGSGGWVTWSQLQEIQQPGWAIASHTVNHVDLSKLDDDTMQRELAESIDILQQHGFTDQGAMLVVPFGGWSAKVATTAKEYFSAIRTASAQRKNPWEEYPPSHPRYQEYVSVVNTDSVATVLQWVDEAAKSKRALHLAWHQVVPKATSTYQFDVAGFEQVVAHVKELADTGKLDVPTMLDTIRLTKADALCMP